MVRLDGHHRRRNGSGGPAGSRRGRDCPSSGDRRVSRRLLLAAVRPGPKSSLTALRVEIAPDGFTVRRGDRGFLLGYVLAGAVRAQADSGLAVVYEAGESFVEHPWTANSIIENPSRTQPASLLVIFAAAPNTPLPVFDR